jgi:hypothetical protein
MGESVPRGKRERPRDKWFWSEYRQHPWGVAVLALLLAFGLSGVITYRYISQPAQVQYQLTPGPTVTATPHAAATHPASHHSARTHSARPSTGYANIPGVTPYTPPSPTPTPTVQSRAPPTPTPSPTTTTPTEAPSSDTATPPDTGFPSPSVSFPTPPF